MIVLGIDPGTAALGYGIVDRSGGRLRAVDYGCLRRAPDSPLPERLLAHPRARRRAHRDAPARTWSRSSGCSSRATPRRPSRSARRGGRAARGGPGRRAGPRGDAERGQGRGHRLRRGRQGAGRADGPGGPGAGRGAPPDDAADALAIAICIANSEQARAAGRRGVGSGAASWTGRRSRRSRAARRPTSARSARRSRRGRDGGNDTRHARCRLGDRVGDRLGRGHGRRRRRRLAGHRGRGHRVPGVRAPSVIASATPGGRLKLHTYHLVREDQQALTGSATPEELGFFKLLLTVTGVGPKVALAIVGSRPTADLQLAILQQDQAVLVVDPGDRQEARRADHLRAQGEGGRGGRRGAGRGGGQRRRARARSWRRSRRSATRCARRARRLAVALADSGVGAGARGARQGGAPEPAPRLTRVAAGIRLVARRRRAIDAAATRAAAHGPSIPSSADARSLRSAGLRSSSGLVWWRRLARDGGATVATSATRTGVRLRSLDPVRRGLIEPSRKEFRRVVEVELPAVLADSRRRRGDAAEAPGPPPPGRRARPSRLGVAPATAGHARPFRGRGDRAMRSHERPVADDESGRRLGSVVTSERLGDEPGPPVHDAPAAVEPDIRARRSRCRDRAEGSRVPRPTPSTDDGPTVARGRPRRSPGSAVVGATVPGRRAS